MPGTPSGRWPQPSDVAERRGPVVHALFRLSRKNRAMVADALRPLGLYPGQELLLLQFGDDDCRSQAELVELLGLDHSTVTKMLQRMERAGMVERRQSEEDRRVVLVSLTQAGCAARGAVEEVWQELEDSTVAVLSDRQRSQLLSLLRKVEDGLDCP